MLAVTLLTVFSLAYISGLSASFAPDAKVRCANNGVGFSDGRGNFFCKCAPNFSGKQCQIIQTTTCAPVAQCNACAISPCQNGMCQNIMSGPNNCQASCSCFPGYYGQFCQYQVTTPCTTTSTTTPCTTTTTTTPCPTTTPCNPCQNMQCGYGSCQNLGNCQATCTCWNGYYGPQCQYQITTPTTATTTPCTTTTTTTPCNPCAYTNCGYNGYCQPLGNCQAQCVCTNGYAGQNCQFAPTTTTTTTPCTTTTTTTSCNPCAYTNCGYNGYCRPTGNCQATCQCNNGFYGQNCQYQVTTTCAPTTTSTTTCAPPTTTYCPPTTTYCPPGGQPINNPCQNSPCAYGTCYNNGYGQPACQCYPGFTGPLCNICTNYQVARAYLSKNNIKKPMPHQ